MGVSHLKEINKWKEEPNHDRGYCYCIEKEIAFHFSVKYSDLSQQKKQKRLIADSTVVLKIFSPSYWCQELIYFVWCLQVVQIYFPWPIDHSLYGCSSKRAAVIVVGPESLALPTTSYMKKRISTRQCAGPGIS